MYLRKGVSGNIHRLSLFQGKRDQHCALRDRRPNSASESDDIDEDSSDVSAKIQVHELQPYSC